jgi:hypothetical protein
MLVPSRGRTKRPTKSYPLSGGLRFVQFGPPGVVPAPAHVPDARDPSTAAPANPPATGDAIADPRGQMDADQAA